MKTRFKWLLAGTGCVVSGVGCFVVLLVGGALGTVALIANSDYSECEMHFINEACAAECSGTIAYDMDLGRRLCSTHDRIWREYGGFRPK